MVERTVQRINRLANDYIQACYQYKLLAEILEDDESLKDHTEKLFGGSRIARSNAQIMCNYLHSRNQGFTLEELPRITDVDLKKVSKLDRKISHRVHELKKLAVKENDTVLLQIFQSYVETSPGTPEESQVTLTPPERRSGKKVERADSDWDSDSDSVNTVETSSESREKLRDDTTSETKYEAQEESFAFSRREETMVEDAAQSTDSRFSLDEVSKGKKAENERRHSKKKVEAIESETTVSAGNDRPKEQMRPKVMAQESKDEFKRADRKHLASGGEEEAEESQEQLPLSPDESLSGKESKSKLNKHEENDEKAKVSDQPLAARDGRKRQRKVKIKKTAMQKVVLRMGVRQWIATEGEDPAKELEAEATSAPLEKVDDVTHDGKQVGVVLKAEGTKGNRPVEIFINFFWG